jgi:hypothetical protein
LITEISVGKMKAKEEKPENLSSDPMGTAFPPVF